MNKIFIALFFTFLTLGKGFDQGRDFISSLLLHSLGINVQLGDCLGETFDAEFTNVENSIHYRDYPLTVLTIPILINDVYSKCPYTNVMDLVQLIIKRVYDGTVMKNFMDKALKIARVLLDEYENPIHSGATLGKSLGKIIKIVTTKPKSVFSFLEAETMSPAESNGDSFLLVKGLVTALSGTASKDCLNDIINSQRAITAIFEKAKQDFMEGIDYQEILTDVSLKVIQIRGVALDCKLLSLSISLQNVLTKDGLSDISKKIAGNIDALLSAGTNLSQAMKDKNDYDIGYNGGLIGKILLGLSVY